MPNEGVAWIPFDGTSFSFFCIRAPARPIRGFIIPRVGAAPLVDFGALGLGGLTTGVRAFEADAAVGFDKRSSDEAGIVGLRTGTGTSGAFFDRARDAFVGAYKRSELGVLGRGTNAGVAVVVVAAAADLAVPTGRAAVGVFAPVRVVRGLFAPARGLSRAVEAVEIVDVPVC